MTCLNKFNIPIKIKRGEWGTNERIVENPFVFNNIDLDGRGKTALDFGCSNSFVPLELASLGYKVVGVDFRNYPFDHPNFKFKRRNILDLDNGAKFDLIVSVSVIEHIGLGVYHKSNKNTSLIKVIDKLYKLLKKDGTLIITTSIGKSSTDKLLHCFTYEEFNRLFVKFEKIKEKFYLRKKYKYWMPCSVEQVTKVNSHISNRGRVTGSNSVGCFIFKKGS